METLLLLFAIAALSWITIYRTVEHFNISAAKSQLEALHFAFRDMDIVMSLLREAEAGQRGYLLTGSRVYLQPYNAAIAQLPSALADFQTSSKRTRLEPLQASRLRGEALQKIDELATTIRLYEQSGRAAAMEVVNTNRGNDVMAHATRDAKALQEAYFTAIGRDLERLENRNRQALAVSISGNLTAIALLVLVSFRLTRAATRNEQLVTQLSSSEWRYRLLVQRSEAVREEERARLAREIHDALGGALTSLKFGLMTARNDAEKHGASKAVARLHQESAEIDQTIRSLRRLASALRPPLLDQIGFVAALEAYAGEFAERTGIHVERDLPSTPFSVSADQGIGLYRIAQEALTNVARHSHASHVKISIVANSDSMELRIQDNGIGFSKSEAAQNPSLGLLGMQERAELAGAQLTVESAPDNGTTVSLMISPVTKPAASEPNSLLSHGH